MSLWSIELIDNFTLVMKGAVPFLELSEFLSQPNYENWYLDMKKAKELNATLVLRRSGNATIR